jgi:HK97 family phage major capsid protein
MAYTAIADIISPEVLADQVSAKFPDQLVLGNTNLVAQSPDFPMGSPGTLFTIPFWKRVSGFASLTEGTAMTPNKIQTAKENALVSRAGAAYQVLDTAQLVSNADAVSEITTQIARRAAEYIDANLVTQVEKTPNTYNQTGNGAGTMDQNVVIKAIVNTLGDNHEKLLGTGRIIMHSKVYGDLLQLSQIQNNYQSGMDVMKTGTMGSLLGLPVMISDRVTVTTVSGTPQYKTYIVGPGALGLFYQRAVQVEFDRDILLQADVIAATVHFSGHLFGYDDQTSAVVAEDNKSILAVSVTSK